MKIYKRYKGFRYTAKCGIKFNSIIFSHRFFSRTNNRDFSVAGVIQGDCELSKSKLSNRFSDFSFSYTKKYFR